MRPLLQRPLLDSDEQDQTGENRVCVCKIRKFMLEMEIMIALLIPEP